MSALKLTEDQFLSKQQRLALHIAQLPILRKNYAMMCQQYEAGLIGNTAHSRDALFICIRQIKQLTDELYNELY